MRGAKSLEGNNNALYVVDGIPLFNNSMGSDSGIMGEGKAGTEGIADFNPRISSQSRCSAVRQQLHCMVVALPMV